MKFRYGIQIIDSYQKKLRLKQDEKLTKNISQALIPILGDLISQIKKYINYYQTHSGHQHSQGKNVGIEKVFISGKEANLKGFTPFLSFSLNVPFEIANPWVNILPSPLKEVPGLSFKDSLEYAAALGLALRAIQEEIL